LYLIRELITSNYLREQRSQQCYNQSGTDGKKWPHNVVITGQLVYDSLPLVCVNLNTTGFNV